MKKQDKTPATPVTPATTEKLWLSVADLAKEWGVEEGWIRDHATRKQPRIRAHKFGKFLRFHRDDIDEFVQLVARPAA